MFTASMIRTALLSAWLTLAALASSRALAELPQHLDAGGFGPELTDFDLGDGIPSSFDLRFGDSVAMRNGTAFVSIPFAHGGTVAVFNLTASGSAARPEINLPIPNAEVWAHDRVPRRSADHRRPDCSICLQAQQRRVDAATDPAAACGGRRGAVSLGVEVRSRTLLASAARDGLPGLVYVFELGTDGRFFLRASLRARDARPDDGFGGSLSMTKQELVMGSSGAAYIFRRNSLGNWVQGQKLVPAGTAEGFGASVAIDQGMIIVGAPAEDIETEFDTPDGHWAGGAAYVFLPGVGRYVESLRLRPRVDEKDAYLDFGSQVAMFGRYIAIKAVGRPTFQSLAAEGIVFTYTREGSTVLARGIASSHFQSNSGNISMALANNWLRWSGTLATSGVFSGVQVRRRCTT